MDGAGPKPTNNITTTKISTRNSQYQIHPRSAAIEGNKKKEKNVGKLKPNKKKTTDRNHNKSQYTTTTKIKQKQ